MFATEVLLTLLFVRLVLPIGFLFLIGEGVRRHRRAQHS